MSSFSERIDLAAERVGGQALLANDEFFAPKENLLKPGRGVFIEGKYTDRGKWMDGWETRRRRVPGHDWCILRLGLAGVIQGVTVDTHHFKGNHPESCSLDACLAPTELSGQDLTAVEWTEIVPRTRLEPHTENELAVIPPGNPRRFSHVRLNIFPDGGVARLRIWGVVQPDWERLRREPRLDLLAIEHGGRPLSCSDRFFSDPLNLIMPGRGIDMGDGWETRRRRGPGYDWVVLALGARGVLAEAVVDTCHFKGNYPDSCSLEGCDLSAGEPLAREPLAPDACSWQLLLPQTLLSADREHRFQLASTSPLTHVRFNIFPDGGVSRLRLFGRPVSG